MELLFYTTYISVDLAHHEIVHAKVGKDGITSVPRLAYNSFIPFWFSCFNFNSIYVVFKLFIYSFYLNEIFVRGSNFQV